jgi:AcrR family transcriptional regulator
MARTPGRTPRASLSKERVLRAAVALADAGGIAALSMRRLAEELGVEAMSLYHHVADKEEILDGMVDAVFGEIELPSGGAGWRAALRVRASSTRAALSRHPWALGLMESRATPGPATLRHHDAVLGCLRGGGFSVAQAARAFALLDAYVYGFALQEQSLPFDTAAELPGEVAQAFHQQLADQYPHLTEMLLEHVMKPGYAFAKEFELGLDVILDGLEQLRHGGRRRARC